MIVSLQPEIITGKQKGYYKGLPLTIFHFSINH